MKNEVLNLGKSNFMVHFYHGPKLDQTCISLVLVDKKHTVRFQINNYKQEKENLLD